MDLTLWIGQCGCCSFNKISFKSDIFLYNNDLPSKTNHGGPQGELCRQHNVISLYCIVSRII